MPQFKTGPKKGKARFVGTYGKGHTGVSRISHASNVGKKRGTAVGYKRELMRTDGQGIGEPTPTKRESRQGKHQFGPNRIGKASSPVTRGAAKVGRRTHYLAVINWKNPSGGLGGGTSSYFTTREAATAFITKEKTRGTKRGYRLHSATIKAEAY